ncbi:DUF4391 domain-containing protein [Azonexus hydrophilus]|uniref:DUF4391 domain-containing protein n=1 Tax=Azonexus hydrophilus TaxID=418702 RepID=UPI002490FE79|nr:DUF4391 domain-containing protein [Azonexus hydrophilus]
MVRREIEQIVWQYKLAPETVNLPATRLVPEIQIFSIALRVPTITQELLRCIDAAIKYPVIYELNFAGKTQIMAAHKRPGETDANRWLIGEYFAGDWRAVDVPRSSLPMALDLGGLYAKLLQPLIPLATRPGESLAELVQRAGLVRAKQQEVGRASSHLAAEKHYKRKVEINRQLRQLTNELEALCH